MSAWAKALEKLFDLRPAEMVWYTLLLLIFLGVLDAFVATDLYGTAWRWIDGGFHGVGRLIGAIREGAGI